MGELFGIILIFILVIVFVNMVKAGINREGERRKKVIDQWAQEEYEEEYRRIVDEYAASNLLNEILNIISDGNYEKNLPEEITIHDDRIEGKLRGTLRVYDFVANRVPLLQHVYEVNYTDPEIKKAIQEHNQYQIRPQLAIADAINRVVGDEYDIIDEADTEVMTSSFTDEDGYTREQSFAVKYSSNFVCMRLKPIKSFLYSR